MKMVLSFLIGVVVGFMIVSLFNTIATRSSENLHQYTQQSEQ